MLTNCRSSGGVRESEIRFRFYQEARKARVSANAIARLCFDPCERFFVESTRLSRALRNGIDENTALSNGSLKTLESDQNG